MNSHIFSYPLSSFGCEEIRKDPDHALLFAACCNSYYAAQEAILAGAQPAAIPGLPALSYLLRAVMVYYSANEESLQELIDHARLFDLLWKYKPPVFYGLRTDKDNCPVVLATQIALRYGDCQYLMPMMTEVKQASSEDLREYLIILSKEFPGFTAEQILCVLRE